MRPSKTVDVEVNVSRDINSDVETVWQFYSDFNGLHKWVPGIKSSELEGDVANNTVGAKRVLTFGDGKQVHETLVDYQPEAHTLTYTIPGDDLGVRGYKSVMSVKSKTDNTSVFTWSATFEAVKGYEDKTKDMVTNLFSTASDVIVNKFQ